MKISMLSTWSLFCGASVHAQLIGNAWVKQGHKPTVFAPHGVPLTETQDEPWVIRNYSLAKSASLDPAPLLDMDSDIFLLQQIPQMPIKSLLPIASKIRSKAKTVVVIHQGRPPSSELCEFPWDAVVCFDERYRRFLVNLFSEEKIHIIPYPCYPVKHGDKIEAREKLRLSPDKMILFIYGVAVHQYFHLLPLMERINKENPLIFVVITGVRDWFDLFEAAKRRYDFIALEMRRPSMDELYTYLHASDALIYHRDSSVDVVVPSTIYTCMGSGCPILALYSNFVETLETEVLKYKNLDELQELLLRGRDKLQSTVEAAAKYANRNSADNIAIKFIELFERLKERR